MRVIVVAALLAALVFAVGCAPVRSGTYTLASTSLGPDDLGGKFVLVEKGVTKTASNPIFIFQFGIPRDYKVIEDILEEHNGDLLTNLNITTKSNLFLFIVGSNSVTIECDVWRKASAGDYGNLPADQLKSLDEVGEVGYSRLPELALAGTGGAR